MAIGRPTKLTEETTHKICEAIKAGNYYEAACGYAGIDYTTFALWMKRGREAKSGMYFDFFNAVTEAEGYAEIWALKQWRDQIPDNWAAARDFLARRFPKRWGPKVAIDVNVRERAEKWAEKHGLDADAVLARAESIIAGEDD